MATSDVGRKCPICREPEPHNTQVRNVLTETQKQNAAGAGPAVDDSQPLPTARPYNPYGMWGDSVQRMQQGVIPRVNQPGGMFWDSGGESAASSDSDSDWEDYDSE